MRGFKSERNRTGGNGPKNQESLSLRIEDEYGSSHGMRNELTRRKLLAEEEKKGL